MRLPSLLARQSGLLVRNGIVLVRTARVSPYRRRHPGEQLGVPSPSPRPMSVTTPTANLWGSGANGAGLGAEWQNGMGTPLSASSHFFHHGGTPFINTNLNGEATPSSHGGN